MKRLFSLLLTFLLIAGMMMPISVTASNDEPFDSTDVNESIKDKYDPSEATLLLQYKFSSTKHDSFSGSDLKHGAYRDVSSFSDLFAYLSPENCFVYWNNGSVESISPWANTGHVISAESLEINENNEVVFPFSKERISLEVFEFYKQDNLSKYLGKDVTILKKYFVQEADTTNSMILYVTDQGNYVYFDNDQVDPCLFSESAFFDYLHLVYELNTIIIGSDFKYNVCDLSAYTLGNANFDPNANNIPWVPQNLIIWLCICIVILVAAIAVIAVAIYRKKVKAHNPYEERQGTGFDGEFVFYHNIDDRAESMDNQPARMT